MNAMVLNEAEYADLIRRIEFRVDAMTQQAGILTARVKAAMAWLGAAGEGVSRLLQQMWQVIGKIRAEILDKLPRFGVPWTLWSHGKEWSGAPVAGRVSGLVSSSTLDAVRSDDYWQGRAADAYRNTLPRQKEALAALVSNAQKIDDLLAKMAVAIGAMWLAVLTAFIELGVALSAATAVGATGVGAPIAAASGLLAVVKLIGTIIAIFSLAYSFIAMDVAPVYKDMEQALHDRSAFGDHWPSSTAFDPSDGSLSDGDGTDWHVRQ